MNPNPVNENFFVAGGTLKASTPSYVKRPTDDELFEAVLAGELCYVLTPRQMGKSSLMIRTSRRLEEQKIRAAIVDLTGIGTKVTIQQWYTSLLMQISRSLKLAIDVPTWVREREAAGYVQLFTDFIEEVALGQLQQRIVIFIDEIDSTLGLDFRDDFFAGLRSLYNGRTEKPALERITFVLLGVASPSDLISDTARTPFNIGHPIALKEFSLEEASVLEFGLESRFPGQGKYIFNRIFYWTNGLPYLTQKLCKTIVDGSQPDWPDEDIDNLVNQLFLSEQARKETNLKFVQDRILTSPERAALLKLYKRILLGQVSEDGQSTLQNHLKLSGLVEPESGVLTVRNRIYQTVFSAQWVHENTPTNWSRIAAISFAVFSLALLLIFIYDFMVGIRSKELVDDFYSSPSAIRQISDLAELFRLRGILQNTDFDYKARELFFNMEGDKQIALFREFRNTKSDIDLIDVIEGLYVTLANVEPDQDSTPLLQEMANSLDGIDYGDAKDLHSEILLWLDARKEKPDSQEAYDKYKETIDKYPNNPATHFERAKIALQQENYDVALSDLDRTMALAQNISSESSEGKISTPMPLLTSTSFTLTDTPAAIGTNFPQIPTGSRSSPSPIVTASKVETVLPDTQTVIPTIQPISTPEITRNSENPVKRFRSSFYSIAYIRRAIVSLLLEFQDNYELMIIIASNQTKQGEIYSSLYSAGILQEARPKGMMAVEIAATQTGVVVEKTESAKQGLTIPEFRGTQVAKQTSYIQTKVAQFLTATPFPISHGYLCPDLAELQLLPNAAGKVQKNDVRLLKQPGATDSSSIIRTLKAKENIRVVDGPQCVNNITWWKIYTESTDVGWTQEIDPKLGRLLGLKNPGIQSTEVFIPTETPTPPITPSPPTYSQIIRFDSQSFDLKEPCWINELGSVSFAPSSSSYALVNFRAGPPEPTPIMTDLEGFRRRADNNWQFGVDKNRPSSDSLQSSFSGCLGGQQIAAISLNVWMQRLRPESEFGIFVEDENNQRREYSFWTDPKDNTLRLRIRENNNVENDYVQLIINPKLNGVYPSPYYQFSVKMFLEIDNQGRDIFYLDKGPGNAPLFVEDINPTQMMINNPNLIMVPTLGKIKNIGLVGRGPDIQVILWPLTFFSR